MRKILLILVWTVGLMGIGALEIANGLFELIPIRKYIDSFSNDSRFVIERWGRDGAESQHKYNVVIRYVSGRKGPYATLRVYDAGFGMDIDAWTTPTLITTTLGLELDDYGIGVIDRSRWGSGLHGIRVAEDEFGLARSYIQLVNTDEDYEQEFLIIQSQDVNRRAMPIATGKYLLDYVQEDDKWLLSEYDGAYSFLGVRSNVRFCQEGLLLALLIISMLALVEPNRRRRLSAELCILSVIVTIPLYFMYWDIGFAPVRLFLLVVMIHPVSAILESRVHPSAR